MQCVSFAFCRVLGTREKTKWSPVGDWIYETEHPQCCLAKDAKTIWEFLCGVKMYLNVQEKCVDWTQRKLMNTLLRNSSPWWTRAIWPPLESQVHGFSLTDLFTILLILQPCSHLAPRKEQFLSAENILLNGYSVIEDVSDNSVSEAPFASLSSLSQPPCFIIFIAYIPMTWDDHLFSIPLCLLIPSILKCHEVGSSLLTCTVLPALGLCPRCYRYLRNIWTMKEHQISSTSCGFLCICGIYNCQLYLYFQLYAGLQKTMTISLCSYILYVFILTAYITTVPNFKYLYRCHNLRF